MDHEKYNYDGKETRAAINEGKAFTQQREVAEAISFTQQPEVRAAIDTASGPYYPTAADYE
jgi:hypothetical protein